MLLKNFYKNGAIKMTIEGIDDLITDYIIEFDEEPLVVYPQTLYEGVYVQLMQNALKRGKPYTEQELNEALGIVAHQELSDVI